MDFHRPSAIQLCLLSAALISAKIGSCRGDLQPVVAAAFGGGYYELHLPSPREEYLTSSLKFNSSRGSGLLLAALGQDNTSYVAVGLDHWRIVVSALSPDGINRGSTFVPSWNSAAWWDLRVQVNYSSVVVTLNEGNTWNLSIQPITFSTVYVGGVPSFIDDPFSSLPVSSSFTGCISNVTANNASLTFVPAYGLELGCCPSPSHVSWTFYGHASSLNVPLPADQSIQSTFELSMGLLVEGDGTLLYSTTGNSSLAAEVVGRVVVVQLWTLSDVALNVSCGGAMSDGGWHVLSLAVSPTLVTCSVDAVNNSVVVDSLYPLGSELNFGLQRVLGVTTAGFSGSVRHLQLNQRDISAHLTPDPLPDGPFVAGICPCQLFEYNIWDSVSVVTKTAGVQQGGGVLINGNVFTLNLPIDHSVEGEALRALYYDAIVFSVTTHPSYGSIRLGSTSSTAPKVSTFRYSDFASGSVFYQQDGGMSDVDTSVLEAIVVCGGRTRHLARVTLHISIGHHPYSTSLHDLEMVVGTRALITSYTIAFADIGTSPSDIKYTLVQVSTMSGVGSTPGTVENIFGAAQVYFTQADIDAGQIVFSHNMAAGLQPIVIELRISDASSQPVTSQVAVFPHQPLFNVTTGRSPGLVARTSVRLGPANLLTVTNFNHQFPAVVYKVTTPPRQGYIVAKLGDLWGNASTFTQAQLNNGNVLYVHTGVAGLDSLSYRVYGLSYLFPSSNLTGPDGKLEIDIIQLSNVSLWASNITVDEGRGVVINSTSVGVAVAVEGVGGVALVEEGIQISILGPFHGSLSLSGLAVGNSSFSLRQLRSGQLTYTHDGSEVHGDSFQLSARALLGLASNYTTVTVVVPIIVVPVDNHAPSLIQRTPINPSEGLWVAVTSDMLDATDPDLPQADLNISVSVNGSGGFGGYFVYRSGMEKVDTLKPIASFRMSDIYLGHIMFVHSFGYALNGVVLVVVTDAGGLLCTGNILVAAQPMNITASPIILPGLPCIARLDATTPSPAFSMNQSMVSLDLNDIGRKPSVMVLVVQLPTYGTLVWNTTLDATSPTNWLLWDHISNMKYTFNPQAASDPTVTIDTFSLQFALGHGSSQSVHFDVCIHPIPVPSMTYTGPLTVTQGGVGLLNRSVLVATDTDQSPDNKLVYYIQIPPVNGYIYRIAPGSNMGAHVTNFTQADVSANQIAYKNVMNQTLGDSFTFVLGNGYAKTAPYKVAINITVTSLIVINRGFSCTEGLSHIITTDELNVIAPHGYSVTFYLLSRDSFRGQPTNGQLLSVRSTLLLTSFTPQDLAAGNVQYTNNGANVATDSFLFLAIATPTASSLSSLGSMTAMDVVNITVILVNDNTPTLINHTSELSVVWYSVLQFDSTMLAAYDGDARVSIPSLRYIISPLNCGEMRLSYRQEPVLTFLEADIRNGSLYYKNTNTVCLQDIMLFYVTDGVHQSSSEITRINIKKAILTPVGSMTITVPKRGTGIITTSSLNCNVKSFNPVTYSYQVKVPPQYGELKRLSDIITNFSQSDINSNKISYQQMGTDTPTDTFQLLVTIPSETDFSPVPLTFTITIQAIDDEPPVMTILKTPLYAIEGSVAYFTSSYMCAYVYYYLKDNRDCSGGAISVFDNIRYTITKAPLYGRIELSKYRSATYTNTTTFSQFDINFVSVRYVSTTVGRVVDTFSFKIDNIRNVQPLTYHQDIVMLPQVLPLNVTGITLYEGGAANISSQNIAVLHPYLFNVSGTVSVQTLPRHGTLLRMGVPTTANFSSSDLKDGTIEYVHDHSDTSYDQFQFFYVVEVDGHCISSNLTIFPITVVLLNDEPPVLARSNVQLNVWDGETIVLDAVVLNATDLDTNDTYLVYNVTTSCGGVYLAIESNRSVPVTSFSQQDVVDRRVLFVHQAGHNGTVTFDLTDGVAVISGAIHWVASELVLSLINDMGTTVPLGGMVPFTRDNLLVVSNDTQPRGLVVYQVLDATYGVIVRDQNPTAVTEFNQREVDAGRIGYLHTKTDYWEGNDTVKLRAGTRLTTKTVLQVLVPILIQLPQAGGSSPLAVCRPLPVRGGGQSCLNESFLDARNLRYAVWKARNTSDHGTPSKLQLTYVITTLPQHGVILVRNTTAGNFSHDQLSQGLVCYQQNGSYSPNDTFGFRVVVGFQLLPYALQMAIVIVPTHLASPWLVRDVQQNFIQGFPAVITNKNLRLTDVDTLPEELVYYPTVLPSNGRLSVSGVADPTNFTQAAIDSGLLLFRPDTVGSTTFAFNFTNGVRWGCGNLTLSIVQHTLTAAPRQFLVYRQDSPWGVVKLDAATNGNRKDTFYTLIQQPRSGHVMANDRQPSSGFSQQDIDRGNVRYIPTDLSAYADTFAVNVTNRNKSIANVSVVVTVTILGQVRADLHLDMSAYPSQGLPTNTLDLTALQKKASIPPTIYVHRPPTYGFLTMSYLQGYKRSSDALGGSKFSFRYDDLKNGWVNYTWAPRQYANWSHCINESFTALVQAKGFQVGVVNIHFTVQPPPTESWMTATGQPSTVTSSAGLLQITSASSSPSSDKFPIYALVPIGGVLVLIPLLAGTAVLLYCIQQKNLRLKFLHPKETHNSPSPWGGQHTQPQLQSHVPNYQDNLSVESEEEEGSEDSDHGSRLGGGSQRTSSAGGRPHSSSSQGYLPRRHASNVMVNISQHFLSEHSLEHPAISPSPVQRGTGSLRSSSRSPTKYSQNESAATTRNTSADSGFRSAAVGEGLSGSRGTVRGGACNNSTNVNEHVCTTTSIPILKKEEYWV